MGWYYPSPEKRIGSIEYIEIQEGYRANDLDRGYFCKVSQDGICVEAFASGYRKALRLARKAWIKESSRRRQEKNGYPRVLDCEERNHEEPEIEEG